MSDNDKTTGEHRSLDGFVRCEAIDYGEQCCSKARRLISNVPLCREHLREHGRMKAVGAKPSALLGAHQNRRKTMEAFENELTNLINQHCIENVADMPDFLLARMICRMIEAMGPSIKQALDWHGCDSVCHPSPNEAPRLMKGE
jgi:hypothetical protein